MGVSHEEAWRTATNPHHLIRLSRVRSNGRKYLLLACAIVRHLMPGKRSDVGGRVLDELERFAFPQPARGVKTHLWREVVRPRFSVVDLPSPPSEARRTLGTDASWLLAFQFRLHALTAMRGADVNVVLDVLLRYEPDELRLRACELIREVFGNPFRPPVIEPGWLACDNGAVKHIAEQIAAAGHFADLPILADALEDAGCRDEELLRHCREGRMHVPGCWALDAVLGRG
jgi:hypothetical protein